MKYLTAFISACMLNLPMLGQKSDSLELELKKKQLELQIQELELKKQEFEMKKEEYVENKEERKERQAEYRKNKEKLKEQTDHLSKLMQSNTNVFFCPLPLFVGGMEGGVEKRIAEKKSLRLMAGYYFNENVWYYRMAKNMHGGRINLQYRFYLDKTMPGIFGLYIAPEVGAKRIEYTQTIYEYDDNNPNDPYFRTVEVRREAVAAWAGFVLGTQEIIFKRITFDVHAGANVMIPLIDYESTHFTLPLVNPYGKGAQLKLALSVGVPF